MLFPFEIVALATALIISSSHLTAACESAVGVLPQSAAAQAETEVSLKPTEAVTSENADLDALESARFVRLDEGEMFALVTASFAAPEDTTGSILLPTAGDSPALDGWEDR